MGCQVYRNIIKIFKTEKTIEMQQVGPTEVCGKV